MKTVPCDRGLHHQCPGYAFLSRNGKKFICDCDVCEHAHLGVGVIDFMRTQLKEEEEKR